LPVTFVTGERSLWTARESSVDAMIVLFCLAIILMSFTRVSMWLLITLLFILTLAISVSTHDAGPIKVTALAVIGAFVVYMPVVFLSSFIIGGGLRVAFRQLRVLYFVFVLILFVVLVMNMTQLVGII
jgi:hypothetical protein